MLRVVAVPEPAEQQIGPSGSVPGGPFRLFAVPDPRSRAPGRGAWLHLDPDCARLAERRRAFARALRVPAVDPEPVVRYVEEHSNPSRK